ncbi:PREDICTED: pentatricopeptide repeat-containing protein At3g13880-like [Camelina sativa]|uniref:Pentatricopeptide repeat-containing protein At3g13880-like n=1 Tax=Camelina sativa TaxID=90675 RepID=A0ABM0W3Q9_CAMSA|nr:PREDICTED: pentatricopeptide repeat-containing protein At3g13880-like [Camelina sativa]
MLLQFRAKTSFSSTTQASLVVIFTKRVGLVYRALSSLCQPKNTALDSIAYTKLFQTAAKSGSVELGKLAHGHMIKSSLNPCLYLLNNLLNMYSKCRELGFARQLFDRMPERNIISFNSLISGYTQIGFYEQAMELFLEARDVNLKLDKFTYAGALGFCGERCDLALGKSLHGLVVVNGLSQQVFLINVLIDMYSKCGNLDQAMSLFDRCSERDQVSWNSLISGYVRVGAAEEPLNLLAKMHRDGLNLTTYALGSVLKACCVYLNEGLIGKGMAIHCYAVKLGMEFDIVVRTALLHMYAKNGSLKESIKLFSLMPAKNVITYNAMISGFLQMDEITEEASSEAFNLFMDMQRLGFEPSPSTFSAVLKACSAAKTFEYGKQVHALICKNNFQSDEFIGSALIELYALTGSTEDGMRCFAATSKQDIASWTSMIDCHVQNQQLESAFDLFRQLFLTRIRPEEYTVSLMMSACADFAALSSGEQIQGYAIKSGIDAFTSVKTSCISMYAKSGNMPLASKIFTEVQNPDVAAYSAMISSLAQHGYANNALDIFESMKTHGIKPNQQAFLGVLIACCHGGLVTQGLDYFQSMKNDYGINPNEKHFTCLVDLLGRKGRLSDAENLILSSGFEDHPVMWRALLSSCRVYKDSTVGSRVSERLLRVEPEASGSYVLLHNIYNESGVSSSAEKVRELMRDLGVKKEPALSWIVISNQTHSFAVADWSHPSCEMIYTTLETMMNTVDLVDYNTLLCSL